MRTKILLQAVCLKNILNEMINIFTMFHYIKIHILLCNGSSAIMKYKTLVAVTVLFSFYMKIN